MRDPYLDQVLCRAERLSRLTVAAECIRRQREQDRLRTLLAAALAALTMLMPSISAAQILL